MSSLIEEFRSVAAELQRNAELVSDPRQRAGIRDEARSWRKLADDMAAVGDLSVSLLCRPSGR